MQARLIPISEKAGEYAETVRGQLTDAQVVNGTAGLRVDIDTTNERMQKKIRDAQLQKIPYMLVVGEREAENGTVAVRLRSGKDLGAMTLDSFLARIKLEAESRRDVAE
jgi:threonyl-tRNA synthetase